MLLPFERWHRPKPVLENLPPESQSHDEEITKTRKSKNTKQGDVVQESIALAILRRSGSFFRVFDVSVRQDKSD
jgi:hypothetical protein